MNLFCSWKRRTSSGILGRKLALRISHIHIHILWLLSFASSYHIACRRYIPYYESYPISLTSWTLWPMIWYFMHSQGCTTWRKERTGLAIGVFGACWRYELSGHRPIPWTVCKHAQILHRYLKMNTTNPKRIKLVVVPCLLNIILVPFEEVSLFCCRYR